jgi:hypothetical protein
MVVVYIASPYTNGDKLQNVNVQLDMAHKLMNLGYCPIIPLFSHYQHIRKPRPYEDWLKIDLEKIRRCDILLRLPGESSGADREVKFAKAINIPIIYNINELKFY